jgi:hypothetical protein
MKTRILEEAYKELNSAIDYYEGEQDGLGLRMFEEEKQRQTTFNLECSPT